MFKYDKSHFQKAIPVWIENDNQNMNMRVIFQTVINHKGNVFIHLATSCIYNLFVNGEFVSYGPARAGRNVFRKDIIPLTVCGNSSEYVITVEVQSYQVNSYYIMQQEPFLQAEILADDSVVSFTGGDGFVAAIDKTLVRKTQRFSFQRPFIEGYRLEENSYSYRVKGILGTENIICLKEKTVVKRNSPYPEYEKISTKKIYQGIAKELSNVQYKDSRSYTGISDKLKGFNVDELEWHISREIQKFSFESEKLTEKDGLFENEYAIFELPYNIAGFPVCQLSVLERAEIYVIFDEILVDNDISVTRTECCPIVKFCLKPGKYCLKLFEVYSMKYIKLFVAKGKCNVQNVSIISYMHQRVNYQINDDTFEATCLLNAAINTFRANAVDILTDCPSRERGGYPCDSFFTGRVEYLLTENNAVEKSFLQNFLHEDDYKGIAKGMIPMCYPADHLDGVYIPNWGLWLILEIKEYAIRNEDKEIIKAYEKKIRGILDFHIALENEQHLLTNIPEGVFVEWSHANEMVQDINFPSNMLYVAALETASKMYNDKSYFDRAEKVKNAILKYSYIDGFFCDRAYYIDGKVITANESSEVCQYYAFDFNIADVNTHKELYQKLLNDFGPARRKDNHYPNVCFSNLFIGIPLRIEMLIRYGEFEKAYDEIVFYYLPQAQKNGSLWESLNKSESCNHGVSSITAYWIEEIKNKRLGQVLGR